MATTSAEDRTFFADGTAVYQKTVSRKASKLVDAGFVPTAISVNKSLSLIAVGGADTLAVYTISGKLKTSAKIKSSIQKLIWHPCGVNDACLVALSESEVLVCSCAATVKITGFSLSRTPNAEINIADEPLDPVSIAFGPPKADTGVISLYIATRDGDIFGICPFVPDKFVLSVDHMKKLINLSLDDKTTEKEQSGSNGRELSWVSAVTRQLDGMPTTWVDEREGFIIDAPRNYLSSVQGPFRLCPYPESLYGEETVDIACVGIANSTLLIQATKNYLNFYLQASHLKLSWQHDKEVESTTLALVNSVKVSSSSDIRKLIVPGPQGLAFLVKPEKMICVDYRPWQSLLAEALKGGEISKLPPSIVSEEPLSFVYVNNLNTVLMEDRQGGEIKAWETAKSTTNDYENFSQKLTKLQGIITSPDDYRRQVCDEVNSILLRPVEELPTLGANLQTLEKLNELSEFYGRGINDLSKQIIFTEQHIEAQKREARRQNEELASIRARKQSLEPKQLDEKVSRSSKRHSELKSRVDALSQKLSRARTNGKPLGLAEKQWFSELERIQNKMKEYQRRIEVLGTNFSAVGPPSASRQAASSTTTGERPSDVAIAALRNQVNLQSSQIKKLEQKINAF